jgi:hypothetical protein
MKTKSVAKLKKKVDIEFSRYIRTKYSDYRGYVQCVTCRVWKPFNEMQNGHYISRSCNMLRYSEDNCWPQCAGCNVFKKGNYPAYTEFLLNKFGRSYILNLVKISRLTKQWTVKELEDLLTKFKV